MRLRPVLTVVAFGLAVGANAYLLTHERIAPSEAKARHLTVREDPLIGLAYSKSARAQNLAAFGFDEALARRAQDQMQDIEDRWSDKIRAMLENAPEPTAVTDALCGQTNRLRPRYAALRVLVEEKQGVRRALDIARASELAPQDWAALSPIDEVYAATELSADRQEDATLMSLAAVLESREQTLLSSEAPWGRGFASTWSWSRVQKEHPGVDQRVVDYVALLHVVVEIAQSEGGVCGL